MITYNIPQGPELKLQDSLLVKLRDIKPDTKTHP